MKDKVQIVEGKIDTHIADRNNPHNVTTEQIGTYNKETIDSKDSSILSSAKAYVDGVKTALTGLINNVKDNTYTKTDIDSKDSNILNQAKNYVNGIKDTLEQLISNAKTEMGNSTYTRQEIDNKDSSTLSSAKGYADTKKSEANSYTNTQIGNAKTEIRNGNVASATKLQTARNINGVAFDGTRDISISAGQVGAYTKSETDNKISEKLDSLSVSGRNILRGTKDMKLGSGKWSDGTWRQSNSGVTKNVTLTDFPLSNITQGIEITSDNSECGIAQDFLKMESGEYTLSYYVKAKAPNTVVRIQAFWNSSYYANKDYTLNDTNWTRVSITGKLPVNQNNISAGYIYVETPNATITVAAPFEHRSEISGEWDVNPDDKADKSDLDTHTSNRNNPHNVTASQINTYIKSEIDSKDSNILSQAKSYADTKKSEAISSSNTHAGLKNNPHSVTASQVGAYTKAETDSRDSSTLSNAKSYADQKKSEVVNSLNGHTGNRSNPHGVTASQIGAYTKGEVDNKINGITIGGANLIKDTRNYSTGMISSQIGGTGTTTTSEIVNDSKVPSGKAFHIKRTHTATSTTQGGRYFSTGSTKLIIGRTYTWTVLVRGSGTVTQFGHEQGSTKSITLTSDWKRVDHTFTVTRDNVYQFVFYSTQPFDLYFTDIMIVEGNIGVGWHPHPDEMATNSKVDSTLSTAKSYADTKANSVQGNLNSHTGNRSNPHGVTASQIGTYTKSEIDTKDTNTLNSAKSYADGKATSVQNNLNGHTNNRSNPHGVTAGQVGAYTKSEVDNLVRTGVGNIDVGGVNYMSAKYIGNFGTVTSYTYNQDTATGRFSVTNARPSWGCGLYYRRNDILLHRGETFFLGITVKPNKNCKYAFDVNNRRADGQGSSNDLDDTSKRRVSGSTLTANVWTRVWVMYTAGNYDLYNNSSNFGVYTDNPSDVITVDFKDITMVKSNVPVEYSVPEQVYDTRISNSVNDLRNHVIFVGTESQWNSLSSTEKNKYILKAIVE